MQDIKRILSFLLLSCCLIILLAGCSFDFQGQLEQSIQEAFQEKKNLSLKNETPFEWDRLYVFPPYTGLEDVNKALGFQWTSEDDFKTGIDLSDSHCLIILTKDKEVVEYFDFPRNKGDFSQEQSYVLDKKDTVFRVNDEEGFLRVTPIHN